MQKAVIFDLDGTIIDSEIIWFDVYAELCARYGKTYTSEVHAYQLGRPGIVCSKSIIEALGINADPEQFLRERDEIRERVFAERPVTPREGAKDFIRGLRDAGYALGVATASAPAYRDAALEAAGVRDCFTQFVSGDEVAHGKPAPDIYLRVAELLGVRPENCVAIEDGLAGVESAVAAGMQVVGICDGRFNETLPGTTRVIRSFKDLQVSDVAALAA